METLLELLNHIKYKERIGDYQRKETAPVIALITKLIKNKVINSVDTNE